MEGDLFYIRLRGKDFCMIALRVLLYKSVQKTFISPRQLLISMRTKQRCIRI